MQISSLTQFAVVKGETAEEFSERLNEKMRELKGKRPEVEFDGLTAYIKYSETVSHPESLADEYEILGISFHCSQCPAFIPRYREDGEPDHRCRKGGCPHTSFKRTRSDSIACDLLYEMLRKGEVRLCFTESASH